MSESPFPILRPGEALGPGIENKPSGLVYLIPAPSGVIIPVPEYPGVPYALVKDSIMTAAINPKDVLLVNYSKTGTHWIWEILSMVLSKDLSYKDHKCLSWLEAVPLSEIDAKYRKNDEPIAINTHFWLSQMPNTLTNGCKRVYAIRNPKDTLVSLYHHMLAASAISKETSLGEVMECFLYSKYNWYRSYFDHLADAWDNYRDDPKVYFLYYEKLKQDPVAEITALAKYLNQDLSTELIDDIAERTQFEKMKSGKYESEAIIREVYHKEDATLFRKGSVGDWKNYLTVAQNEEFDRYLTEWNKDRQIPFIFELP